MGTSDMPNPSKKNFIGTAILTACALGLTIAAYIINRRRVSSSGGLLDAKESNIAGNSVMEAPGGVIAGGNSRDNMCSAGLHKVADVVTKPSYKSYALLQAEQHVKRHSNNLVEWCDDTLGISILFSPVLFALKREERQAPMILLTLHYLRQESHQVYIAMEETFVAEKAEDYREASLSKISDCTQILSSSMVRIGNVQHPQVEYCYINAEEQLVYVLSVFLLHERLALTIQYCAHMRVKDILPTAFYELIRSIRFNPPRPSPSYLLVSEPRLGLGFRLPLDFRVHDGFVGCMEGVAYERSNNRESSKVDANAERRTHTPQANAHSLTAASLDMSQNAAPPHQNGRCGWPSFCPFATAVGHRTRYIGVIASYEPPIATFDSSRGAWVGVGNVAASGKGGAAAAGTTHGGALTPWNTYLKQQLHSAIIQLGIRTEGPVRIVFRDEVTTTASSNSKHDENLLEGCTVLRPYRLFFSKQGNFLNPEDVEDATRHTLSLMGSCCLQEVRVDAQSPCASLIHGQGHWGEGTVSDAASLPAYFSAFYAPVGDECASFYFLAAATRHTFEEFAGFCTMTMQSVSLGNHHGQSTAVLYCNTRHDVMPFVLTLRPGLDTVEEPQLGDPLVVVHRSAGVEECSVLVRMLPLHPRSHSPKPAAPVVASLSMKDIDHPLVGTALSRKMGRLTAQRWLLEHTMRRHLTHLSCGHGSEPQVLNWEPLTLGSIPALFVCFKLVVARDNVIDEPTAETIAGMVPLREGTGTTSEGADNSADGNTHHEREDLDGCSVITSKWLADRAYNLEEEVGSMNPLSCYYPPPPPALAYLGLHPLPNATPESNSNRNPVKGRADAGVSEVEKIGAGCNATQERKDAAKAQNREIHLVSNMSYWQRSDSGRTLSLCSDSGAEEESLRVAVAVAMRMEGHALLLMASTSASSLGSVQQVVRELASRASLLPSW